MEMLNIFPDNSQTHKLDNKFSMKMSLQSDWTLEDNKTNFILRAFFLSEKIWETNYELWRKLLKHYKAAFFSPFHALNLLPHREDKAKYMFSFNSQYCNAGQPHHFQFPLYRMCQGYEKKDQSCWELNSHRQ